MPDILKIAIPMAGLGTRMRPHTWSKPKPLIALAGKTVLDYVLAQFSAVEARREVEYILIVGSSQVEPIRAFMQAEHPEKKAQYVVQEQMRGQSDALYLAREHLTGPMLMSFSDTLIETGFDVLQDAALDGAAWVMPVPDPRRFGVAELDAGGKIARLVEKPQSMQNNLALVGFYYFRQGERLMAAIEEQLRRGASMHGEFYLVEAVNILLEGGARFAASRVDTWLDAGTPPALLETNRHLLAHGQDNSAAAARPGVAILPPVFIHPTAQVESSVIGPYVSLAAGCVVKDSVVRNTIIDEDARVISRVLEESLLGKRARLEGRPSHCSLGDDSLGAA